MEFLEARLVEDEVMAQEAAQHLSGVWTFDNGEAGARREELARGGRFGANPSVGGITSGCRYNAESEMKHIARHDPDRVLREVAAKRAIVKAYEDADIRAHDTYGGYEDILNGASNGLERALELLTAAYSDHPDFDPDWPL